MELFLELEAVYIVIGIFILSVTAFVTTRDFVPKSAFKRGMLFVGAFVVIMIALHYSATTSRMQNVEEMFNSGKEIICENKMKRTVSRSVILSKALGWSVEDHLFKNSDYERDFHTSRCIEWTDGIRMEQEEKQKKETK
ncbi:MAG: hypothetical protein QG560_664 [Campylobacterota bacterium]|nr:hypothetical protein [Campylobacterota bacterium]